MSNLKWDDIKCSMDVKIIIRKSKTDQFSEGRTITLARQDGKTLFCPVYLTMQYARRLGYTRQAKGFMQPRLDMKGRTTGRYKLGYSTATQDMRELITKCGHDPTGFSEHSGRRGGATEAANLGSSWLALKRKGGWKSDLAAQKYIEEAEGDAVGKMLAEQAIKRRSLQ